ncbi:MAG TPA: hypothetical protein VGE34_01695 [Candidatus Saccharimonadales bacterium]
MNTVTSNDPTTHTWRRWFRRTNVYIAEYILMLVLVASFIGVLVSLWFSFFELIYGQGYFSVATAASQIGALLVVGPAAFWLYARVTGQENVHPELYERKSRTVFLTIWLFFAVLSLVGMVLAVVAVFTNAVFGLGTDFAEALVTKVLPGIFAVATVVFGLFMVVKHTSRKFVMIAAWVLVAMAVVLLIANSTMVLVRKDSMQKITPAVPGLTSPRTVVDDCTFSEYLDKECTYTEYRNSQRSNSSSNSTYPY